MVEWAVPELLVGRAVLLYKRHHYYLSSCLFQHVFITIVFKNHYDNILPIVVIYVLLCNKITINLAP